MNEEWAAVTNALLELACGQGQLCSHSWKPWKSESFEGSRHNVIITFEGSDAVSYGEALIAMLPGHRFALAGKLVTSATIEWVNRQISPKDALTTELQLLLLDVNQEPA